MDTGIDKLGRDALPRCAVHVALMNEEHRRSGLAGRGIGALQVYSVSPFEVDVHGLSHGRDDGHYGQQCCDENSGRSHRSLHR